MSFRKVEKAMCNCGARDSGPEAHTTNCRFNAAMLSQKNLYYNIKELKDDNDTIKEKIKLFENICYDNSIINNIIKSNIDPLIKNNIDLIYNQNKTLRNEISTLQIECARIKSDLSSIKSDVSEIKYLITDFLQAFSSCDK